MSRSKQSHEPRMSGTKKCSRCGEEKHVMAFGFDRKMVEGLASWCRSCHSEQQQRTPSAVKEKAARQHRRKLFSAEIRYTPVDGKL